MFYDMFKKHGNTIEILKNPSMKEMKELFKGYSDGSIGYGQLRFLGNKEECFVWISSNAIHMDIILHMKKKIEDFEYYGKMQITTDNKLSMIYIDDEPFKADHKVIKKLFNMFKKCMKNTGVKFISEAFHSYVKHPFNDDKHIEIVKNPTTIKELRGILPQGFSMLRFFGNSKEIYVWNSYVANHGDMLSQLDKSEKQFTYFGEMKIDQNSLKVDYINVKPYKGYGIETEAANELRKYKENTKSPLKFVLGKTTEIIEQKTFDTLQEEIKRVKQQ